MRRSSCAIYRLSSFATRSLTAARPPLAIDAPYIHSAQVDQRKMAPIPKTMKGVIIEKTGGVEVLQYKIDLPVPTPKADEILVKNEICGVNYIDTYFRTGLYPSKLPLTLGRESAGYALTTSSANPHIKEGQKVVWAGAGGYAEYAAVQALSIQAVPDNIPLSIACAANIQGLTALTLIDEAHRVEKDDWILVTAAAGGVGGWLCQLLRARGAHIIATASTEAKRNLAIEYGADVAVPYEQTLEAVEQHTGGKGVIAVFDGVGQSTFDQSLEALARKGTMVSYGNASGAVEPLRIARLGAKNIKVCRPVLFNYLSEPGEVEHYSQKLWDVIGRNDGTGKGRGVRVDVHHTYPLSEIKQAHMDIEGRKTTGKLLLDPTK